MSILYLHKTTTDYMGKQTITTKSCFIADTANSAICQKHFYILMY